MGGGRWITGLAIAGIVLGALSARQSALAMLNNTPGQVPFVLWFNILGGAFYVAAGIGIIMRHRWAAMLAFPVALATLGVLGVFGLIVASGSAYDPRILMALAVKTALWTALALGSWRAFGRVAPAPAA